ncbi:hypothetical protein [Flavisolibacter nicotianae]|uniref:hypothetical protein n=1 Tax=Flavisolibacter nicotianae TaxID=2364882 RepID=UPI0013C4F2E4|nr:hypothetical protein [Flavisolibacter nicotianae]
MPPIGKVDSLLLRRLAPFLAALLRVLFEGDPALFFVADPLLVAEEPPLRVALRPPLVLFTAVFVALFDALELAFLAAPLAAPPFDIMPPFLAAVFFAAPLAEDLDADLEAPPFLALEAPPFLAAPFEEALLFLAAPLAAPPFDIMPPFLAAVFFAAPLAEDLDADLEAPPFLHHLF